jgi:tetratricopeptide (TPR) repeat protein
MNRKNKGPAKTRLESAAAESAHSTSVKTAVRGRRWIAVVSIILVTVVVYWSIQNNEFVRFDDRKYIYQNTLVTGNGGLRAIWLDLWNPDPKVHYNPMTYTTFWIEHALVGLEPQGVDPKNIVSQAAHPLYHWTQIALHACNAVLVLLTLHALGVSFPVAVLTALFFAVHPVNVESVAWTAERKNLLSGFFFWLSLLSYVTFRRRSTSDLSDRSHRTAPFYIGAILAFGLALLSKTAALVLAPMLIVTDRIIDGKWSWRSVLRAMPFLVMGGVMAILMAAREDALGASKLGTILPLEFRPLVAISAVVHYAWKMLVPIEQALIYPRWELSLLEPRYWISMAVFLLGFALILRYRKILGELWMWGLGLFLITIFPVLGLRDFAWMQFSFVSDHYMYYGSVGVILMVMLGGEKIWQSASNTAVATTASPRRAALAVLSAAALIGCVWQTVKLSHAWENNLTLWQHVLPINPDAFQGHVTLQSYYQSVGDLERAYHHRKEFARIMNFANTWLAAARDAQKLGLPDEALSNYEHALEVASRRNPREYVIHTEYARYLARLGHFERAYLEYEAVLAKRPPKADALRKEMAAVRARLGG